MIAPSIDSILLGLAAAAGVVISTLASITATIDRHARWAELKLETHRLRRSRQRPGR